MNEELREKVLSRLAIFAEGKPADETSDALLALFASSLVKAQREVADIKREVREESAARELAEKEVADLRRKLEEMKERADNWLDDAKDVEARYTEASLANAALRTALEVVGERALISSCGICKDVVKIASTALALPADSIAQEVVWLLMNPSDSHWDARRDALLAKLGGKP